MSRHTTHYQATLVSHTHWDRAWYCTFQEYRVRLVRLIDDLIAILHNDTAYRVYMLDGQMSVLDDYLEARPSQAALLQTLCRSGRIQVGPWFVLADEFLVSPEALIRNLQLGHRIGESYGGVMKIGYVPDGFGHIAQLPQLLRGFGIDNAFFWRGMGSEGDQLGTEFTWQAPDGSAVTTILMPWGYHNVSNLGYAIHWGDTSQMVFDPALAQTKIDRALDKLKPMANTNALLLMNGIDHADPEPRIPQVIRAANDRLQSVTITHGTLQMHLDKVRASGVNLPQFCGEFRWGRYSEILQGVYSTRIHLKQQNHEAETRLERYAEPLTALAWLCGADLPTGTPDLLALAWRWLLLNHPHDDIYGCGIDEVHNEMAYRFNQSRQIADVLVRDSLRQIARQVDLTTQIGTPILVYNPLGWQRREVVEAIIDFEFDDTTPDDMQIVDHHGQPVIYQVVRDEPAFWMEVLKPNRKRRVTVLILVETPSAGWAVYFAQPSQATTAFPDSDLTIIPQGVSNTYTAFSIAPDGGLTLTDRMTDTTYQRLNHFVDTEEIGDAYTSCPFEEGSERFTTYGHPADAITLIEHGPLRVVYQVCWSLAIPRRLSPDRTTRVAECIPLVITTRIMLYAHTPGVFIETDLYNAAEDHKLTVNFPTGIHASTVHVDESFLIAERSLKLPDSTGWVEDPTPLMHQRTFIDLTDGRNGMAVINRGLPSVEVSSTGEIALTLLRCVGWLSRDDLWVRRIAAGPLVPTPGAQCQGAYTFAYALLPHTGDWRAAQAAAAQFNAPLLARRADTHPGLELKEMNITRDDPSLVTPIPFPRTGKLPPVHSFITISDALVMLSALYRSGDSLIVRVYNLTRVPRTAQIKFGFPVAEAWLADLAEDNQAELAVTENTVSIAAAAAGLVTVKVKPMI